MKSASLTGEGPAISFPVNVTRMPEGGRVVRIAAGPRELRALAQGHGLAEVGSFEAELKVARWKSTGVRVAGRVVADVVQSCVVTLEPVEAHVDAPVDAIFVPPTSRLARPDRDGDAAILIDPDGPDLPEVLESDELDLGAVAEEFFELALDPFPRSPGADLPAPEGGNEVDEKVTPFAKLAQLRKDRGE
ncbi:MAG TPA: DUF177 domain-containing protein [Rhizobiaceae bacterium]|nr:DUF177 domain-containing protein [Rhizobiaceae bacterium]